MVKNRPLSVAALTLALGLLNIVGTSYGADAPANGTPTSDTSVSVAPATNPPAVSDEAPANVSLPPVAETFDRNFLKTDPTRRFWIYGGMNLGYSSVSPGNGVHESARDGYAAHLKILGSKYWKDWVADFGIGYQYHHASGDDAFSPFSNATVRVRTRSGFFELSPRYRLDPHWQVGAVLNAFFGADVSFGESITDNSSFSMAGGARVDYETAGDKNRWRFGFQLLHDLTLSDHSIWWAMADVQFGIPWPKGKDAPPPEPAPAPVVEAPKPPERPKAPQFAEVTPEKGVKVYLGEAVLRFQTAKADLRPSSREILVKVSKYLKQAPDAWKSMRVEGHADKRGKLDYNMKLSRSRANRVRSELVRLGVPKSKLSSEGYGPTRPIDPAEDLEAYALNRRVELWIDGVNDADAIVRDLNELK